MIDNSILKLFEENNISVGSVDKSFILAVESYIDKWEQESFVDYIFEAEGSTDVSKARSLINRLAGAFKKKDKELISELSDELSEETKALKEEIDAADTPEEKKRLSKKNKIIIGALLAATVAIAGTVGHKNSTAIKNLINSLKKAKKDEPQPSKNTLLLTGSVASTDKEVKKAKKASEKAKEEVDSNKEVFDGVILMDEWNEKMKKEAQKLEDEKEEKRKADQARRDVVIEVDDFKIVS